MTIEKLTFGGRVPWAIGFILVLVIGASLTVALGSRHVAPFFDFSLLRPDLVLHGQVWRLVTWPFIEPGPLSLLFACLFLYWFGRDLANEWGSAWFLRIFGGVTIVCGVCTTLVGIVDMAVRETSYLGTWPIVLSMMVAWGLFLPLRTVRLFFLISIPSHVFAWLTVAISVVYAVYSGWEHYLPELLAEGSIVLFAFRDALVKRRPKPRRRPSPLAHLEEIERHESGRLSPEIEKQIDELLKVKPKR